MELFWSDQPRSLHLLNYNLDIWKSYFQEKKNHFFESHSIRGKIVTKNSQLISLCAIGGVQWTRTSYLAKYWYLESTIFIAKLMTRNLPLDLVATYLQKTWEIREKPIFLLLSVNKMKWVKKWIVVVTTSSNYNQLFAVVWREEWGERTVNCQGLGTVCAIDCFQ